MAEQTRASTPAEATVTLVESEEDHLQQDVRTVRLRLRKPESKKKVQWQSGTVDNEHLNKKKSKCCCQYEKPRVFGESSSSSEDEECENCHGHVERKKKKKKEPPGSTEDSAEPVYSFQTILGECTEASNTIYRWIDEVRNERWRLKTSKDGTKATVE
ncbi:E3 ubiquitin-protein ligase PPP1R11 isoform X1 [Periplaneta americana]|uniref:E3 ubiquitin-protein ligase PPP1R11 isoform X1 n=1 Tax=Periplaneta americana TaxID=6978 RepID=UPI0037E92475